MADTTKTILKKVLDLLLADATVTGFVSTRIYTVVVEDPVFPFCFVTIDGKPENTFDESNNIHRVRIVTHTKGSSIIPAIDIRAAIYNVLERNSNFEQCYATLYDTYYQDDKTYSSVIEFTIN